MKHVSLAILGEYSSEFEPHPATISAIAHSATKLGVEVNAGWVSTDETTDELFATYSAVRVAPGSPYRNMEKTLWAIQYARENDIPAWAPAAVSSTW